MSPELAMALAAGAVLLGSVVQGTVGFGMALFSAPFVMLVDPSLMPGSLLTVAVLLTLAETVRERHHIDWRGLVWAITGRIPGNVMGAWLVAVVSGQALGVLVAVIVLTGVALTARAVRIPIRPSTLVAAGTVSGISGTATSIGGPPIALLYQHERGETVRGTLSAFFFAGAVISLVVLAIAGELSVRQLVAGALMAPMMAVGLSLAIPLRRRLKTERFRVAVLAVASASAVILLIRTLVGAITA